MTALLSVLIAAVATQGSHPSLLQQIVPNPTGTNGYEEYLMAADIVKDGMLSVYLSWSPNQYKEMVAQATPPANMTALERADFESNRPPAETIALAKHLQGMSVLQVRREAVRRYGKALAYLRKGNEKKVFDPRTVMRANTLLPEYSWFKNVAKLADIASYVDFADGNPHEGTHVLLDAFQMGQNLEGGILISHLVGIAIESIALADFERFLPSIPRDDAAAIERTLDAFLAQPPKIQNSVRAESKFMLDSFADMLRNPAESLKAQVGEDRDDQTDGLTSRLNAMSPTQRDALYTQLQAGLNQALQPLVKTFSEPESYWLAMVEPVAATEEVKMPSNPADLPQYWIDNLMPVFSQIGPVAAKNRTQVRLLALHVGVLRYRWDTGRLPDKLEEAVPEAETNDPLSGQKFVYEREGAYGFRIYSLGAGSMGKIELKYRRSDAGIDGGDSNPPPLTP